MRPFLPVALLAFLSAGQAYAQSSPAEAPIEITTLAERPAQAGPAEYFSGTALIYPLFDPAGARTFGSADVTFFPSARTNWHSHPAGQTLIVTEGVGWVQARGGERREIRAGDVVWTPPGVEHWHGGTAEHAMTHTALQGAVEGEVVTWMGPVSDAEYLGTDE